MPTQGQYLAFIYYYTKIHGVPPAEADIQRYFQTQPQFDCPLRGGSFWYGVRGLLNEPVPES